MSSLLLFINLSRSLSTYHCVIFHHIFINIPTHISQFVISYSTCHHLYLPRVLIIICSINSYLYTCHCSLQTILCPTVGHFIIVLSASLILLYSLQASSTENTHILDCFLTAGWDTRIYQRKISLTYFSFTATIPQSRVPQLLLKIYIDLAYELQTTTVLLHFSCCKIFTQK